MIKNSKNKEKGFSLIEVMVSLSILGFTSSLMLTSFINQIRTINRSVIKSGAVLAASFVLDDIRAGDISALPMSGEDEAIRVVKDSKDYDIFISYCLDSTFCSTNTREITAKVFYNLKEVYSVKTVYTKFE